VPVIRHFFTAKVAQMVLDGYWIKRRRREAAARVSKDPAYPTQREIVQLLARKEQQEVASSGPEREDRRDASANIMRRLIATR